jgi:general secretion pathway protein F
MPRFAYTARDRLGQSVTDTVESPSRKDALRLLAARGLQPMRLVEESGPAKPKAKARLPKPAAAAAPATAATRRPAARSFALRGSVKLGRAHRLPFLQALHDLTTSGLSAGEAVRLLSQRLKEPALLKLTGGLWERISEGAPLSRAMAEYPQVFDEATLNLLQAGEATGSLNDTLARLIEHLTEEKELKRQVATAMAYPVFMMFVSGLVILFFLFFLLPRLQTLLTALGGELPTSTQILVGASEFALRYGIFLVVGVIFAVVSFWRWRETEAGRVVTDGWALRLPLLSQFQVGQTALAFSQTLSVLLENGITTAEALRMTERQIQNRVHRAAFDVATDRVLEGESLSVALTRTGVFPDLVLDQLAVGENTGNVVPALKKIALTYRKELSRQLNVFTRVIASAVLMSVFLFVGFIAYSIVSAVFQLSTSFQM